MKFFHPFRFVIRAVSWGLRRGRGCRPPNPQLTAGKTSYVSSDGRVALLRGSEASAKLLEGPALAPQVTSLLAGPDKATGAVRHPAGEIFVLRCCPWCGYCPERCLSGNLTPVPCPLPRCCPGGSNSRGAAAPAVQQRSHPLVPILRLPTATGSHQPAAPPPPAGDLATTQHKGAATPAAQKRSHPLVPILRLPTSNA